MVQVEELHEYKAPLPSDVAKMTKKGSKMETIKQITELAKSLTPIDSAKFDKTLFDNARRALAELIASEALEMTEGHDERESLGALVAAVHALMAWYEGEEYEGEVREVEEEETIELAAAPDEDNPEADKAADACKTGDCGKCMECMSDKSVEAPDTTQEEESTQAPTTMEANNMVDIDDKLKSADAEEVAVEATEEVSEAEVASDETTSIEDVVEKAVKSAMESVKSEIDALRADKEAAVEKSVKLEEELATALSKSVAGGPKRTAIKMSDEAQNDMLVKAATYKAKAEASTDPLLSKGYRDLANEFFAKATPKKEN